MYLLYCVFRLIHTDLYRSSVEQSQGEDLLELDVTSTIEVSATSRIPEEHMTPFHTIAVSSSGDEGPIAATGLTRRPVRTYTTVQG